MANPHFVQRTTCPACAHTDFTKVYSVGYEDPGIVGYLHRLYDTQGAVEFEYLKDAQYTLQECNNCKLVFQEFIPNSALMVRLYDKWIDPEAVKKSNFKKDSVDYYKRYAAEIINILYYLKGYPSEKKFFDFGMGWGKWCLMAKAFGVDSYGAELSEERISYARSNGIQVITWDEIPGKDFDFINTEQVFEHIPDPVGMMKHLSLGLKSGGIIKISVPNGNDIGNKLKAVNWKASRMAKDSLMVVSPLEHINCYRTQSILEMGKECGLAHVEFKSTYIGFHSLKYFAKIAFRRPYHKYMKKGDIVLYFKKN
jgi:2-polyprenyl-3-methyl-5-hydroxy-6-metoxy-1,4-benzoquinol methylase